MSNELSRDLLDGRDAGQRQEEAEVIREVLVGAGDRLAARKVLGLEGFPVRREDEFGLGARGRRAGLQRGQSLRDLAWGSDGDVDVVGLEDAAKVGFVGLARAQALERRFLVAEGLQEGERELRRVERLLGQGRYCFFDLDSVHFSPCRNGTQDSQLLSCNQRRRTMGASLALVAAAKPALDSGPVEPSGSAEFFR